MKTIENLIKGCRERVSGMLRPVISQSRVDEGPDNGEAVKGMPLNVLINALPKSASLFITRTIGETLGLEIMRIGTRGVNYSHIDPEALHRFVSSTASISQDHISPKDYNYRMLVCGGLTRFVVVVRDPRDALVSWAHHLERKDTRESPWHEWMLVSSGIISSNYYSLSWQGKLDNLIQLFFPVMVDWINGWTRFASGQNKVTIRISTYESFVTDSQRFIRNILLFYNISDLPQSICWPTHSDNQKDGISLSTHYRRGIIGSHRDELSAQQINRINNMMHGDLMERYGWS